MKMSFFCLFFLNREQDYFLFLLDIVILQPMGLPPLFGNIIYLTISMVLLERQTCSSPITPNKKEATGSSLHSPSRASQYSSCKMKTSPHIHHLVSLVWCIMNDWLYLENKTLQNETSQDVYMHQPSAASSLSSNIIYVTPKALCDHL